MRRATASHANLDWGLLRSFLATAERGSYSAAAASLRVAQPTVGRQIATLEAQLGVALFERAGRGVALTPTGVELVEHVRSMAASAERVARVAAGQSLALDGPICIAASEVDAVALVAPLIPALRRALPGLEIELVVSNAPQDLQRREADLALRRFRPTEPELVARRLRDGEARLYAAETYLRTLGRRVTPAALSRATFIGFDRGPALRDGLAQLGLALEPANFAIITASQSTQWALVKAGAGIAIMDAQVGDREPGVVRVVPELPPITIPLWLVTHREVHTSRRVRAVADFFAEHLAGPTREGALQWTVKQRGKGTVERTRPTGETAPRRRPRAATDRGRTAP